MQCHTCGFEVREGQKFCMECGASLRGVADITGEVPIITHRALSDDARDEVTRALGNLEPPTPLPRPAERDWRQDPHATVQLPPQIQVSDDDRTTSFDRELSDEPTNVLPVTPAPTARMTARHDVAPTGSTVTALPTRDRADFDDDIAYDDGYHGVARHDRPHAFHLRPMFVPAVFAAAAAVVAALTTVIRIDPGGSPASFEIGSWAVNDLGTNNAIAGLIAAGALLAGALAWCFGIRWAAGLAGGAGAALAGWAALVLGLAEYPLHVARAQAATTPADLTRDVGWYALAVAGILGAVALVASFGALRHDRGGLDPWIAALGAAAIVVAAAGPLIPLNGLDIDANWSETALGADVPKLFLYGRLVQVGLLLVVGVFGFLIVRRFGLAMAVGASLSVGWLCLTAAAKQTDSPIGPAYANPGATAIERDGVALFEPHGVTVVGLALVAFFALIAVTLAVIDRDH